MICIPVAPRPNAFRWFFKILTSILAVLVWAGVGLVDAQRFNPDSLITLHVEPVSGRIKAEERDGTTVFILPGAPMHTEWLFTYRVENPARQDTIEVVGVWDTFGPGLDIVDISTTYSPGLAPGAIDLWNDGTTHSYSFKWHNFKLKPGEWAELTIRTGPGQTPTAREQYTACKLYKLNSQAILKFTVDGRFRIHERQGPVFHAEIPCPPSLEIKLNTKVTWYLRMPGDYFDRVIEGSVKANHPVIVTFSKFADLKSTSSDHTLPVFYALDED